MDQSAPLDDPFEAFKRKKKAEAEQAQAPLPVESRPPGEDGRPRGFVTHRYDFDKPQPEGGAQPPSPPSRPKGFKTTQLTDGPQPVAEPLPKPKGFKTHHLT